MALPDTLFSSQDGALYVAAEILAGAQVKPVRANYSRTHAQITSVADLKATLRAGEYAWPGGYQMFFAAADGTALSFEGVRDNFAQIVEEMQDRARHGLRGGPIPVLCEINYEDGALYCELTGKAIPAAYESDEEDEDQ